MSKNAGIDYGLGRANVDHATDCRYGVISIHSLSSWIYEELELEYPDPELDEDGEPIEDDFVEAIGQYLDTEEYKAHDAFDGSCLFLTSSKYFTFCKYCSPCAPGAGDLDNPVEDGAKTFCFGHEMFEGGKAPYPVYSVETGELVQPKE